MLDNTKERETFIRSMAKVMETAYFINHDNGFWDKRDEIMEAVEDSTPTVVIACLGLVGSEVAEAMEAARKHDAATWGDAHQKDTLVRELAGTIIRCMDLAGRFELPLAAAILAELEGNAKRGHMHGGVKA
jgi:hypothetical protein